MYGCRGLQRTERRHPACRTCLRQFASAQIARLKQTLTEHGSSLDGARDALFDARQLAGAHERDPSLLERPFKHENGLPGEDLGLFEFRCGQAAARR